MLDKSRNPQRKNFCAGHNRTGKGTGDASSRRKRVPASCEAGTAGSQGQTAARAKECASIPRLFQGVSPLPPALGRLLKGTLCNRAASWGLHAVGRGISTDGRRLPGSWWRSRGGGIGAEYPHNKNVLSLQTADPQWNGFKKNKSLPIRPKHHFWFILISPKCYLWSLFDLHLVSSPQPSCSHLLNRQLASRQSKTQHVLST